MNLCVGLLRSIVDSLEKLYGYVLEVCMTPTPKRYEAYPEDDQFIDTLFFRRGLLSRSRIVYALP